jgi:hypothetical protein
MSRRLIMLVVVVIALGLALARPAETASGSAQTAEDELLLDVGDIVRVGDGAVGCKVTRSSAFSGQKILDCRRAGPLSGTYGALLGDRKLLVVRFRDGQVAKVVFTATHKRSFSRCD